MFQNVSSQLNAGTLHSKWLK